MIALIEVHDLPFDPVMQIHVIQNGEQAGPYSPAQFEEMLQKGLLGGDDLYWHEGCEDWLPVSQHPAFARRLAVVLMPPSSPPPPPLTRAYRRGAPSGNPAKVCWDCGHAVSPSAPICPNCGRRLKMGCGQMFAIGVVVCVVIAGLALLGGLSLLSSVLHKFEGAPSASSGSEKALAPAPPAAAMPNAETAFVSTVQSYVGRYTAAPNELVKTALRTERRTVLGRLVPDRQAKEWLGTLKELSTSSDGKASLSIALDGSAITVHTTTGNPFSPGSDTSVEHGSPLYNHLAQLSPGEKVTFTGSFVPDDQDYLKETSLTEAGSMTEPEFAMRFSEVVLSDLPSSATSNRQQPMEGGQLAQHREVPPPPLEPADAPSTPAPSLTALSNSPPSPLSATPASSSPAWAMTNVPRVSTGPVVVTDGHNTEPSAATGHVNVTEALLIGRWQGARHLTEYRADHTRLMDGVSLNPPRTWRLDGDQLTHADESGTTVYKVVALDQNQLVLAGDNDQRYALQRDQASGDINQGFMTQGAAPSVPALDHDLSASERLLIGRWQGARHVTEYRPDHTRVMDGAVVNPPRTWHLEGDYLSEGPGKSTYKVISLDQKRLVLEGDEGKRYSHERLPETADTVDASVARTEKTGLPSDKARFHVVRHAAFAFPSYTDAVNSLLSGGRGSPPSNLPGAIEVPVGAQPAFVGENRDRRLWLVRLPGMDHDVWLPRAAFDERDAVENVTERTLAATGAQAPPMRLPEQTKSVMGRATPSPTTPVTPSVRLKLFEDERHTCRLLLPEDGWVPVELPSSGACLAVEGPGGIRLSVRPLKGAVGERSLAVLFAREVRERFPFDDMAIQPTEPKDRSTQGARTVLHFSAQSSDPMQRMLQDMPDGPMKQGMLSGAAAGPKDFTLFGWTAITEGSVTWVVELEGMVPVPSPTEIKSRTTHSQNLLIGEKFHLSKEFETNPVLVYVYIRGNAVGRIAYAISRSIFDADGLTPVIDASQQAADPKVAEMWKTVMDGLTW